MSVTVPPPLHIIKEIIWEIVEDNWRLELLALDRCVVSRHGMSKAEAGLRDKEVAACFPSSDFLVRVIPIWDISLGAKDVSDRVVLLKQFIKILAKWPVPKAEEFKYIKVTDINVVNPGYLEIVEKRAFLFYCQLFFN